MKRIALSLIVATVAVVECDAATTLLGNMVAVNNTTSNSTAVAISSVTIPAQGLLIQHGTLTNVYSLTGYAQVSLDGTNFVNIGTYRPSSAAAGTENATIASTNLTIYLRLSAVTTNYAEVGAVLK